MNRATRCDGCSVEVSWASTFWCEACEVRVCGGCFALDHPELVPPRLDIRRPGLPRGGELTKVVAEAFARAVAGEPG